MTEQRVTDPNVPAVDERSSSVGETTHRVANRVRDIMQTKLVTISVTDRLSTVEDIMTLGRVRHIPVVHGGRLVGVLSQRDLLRASLSELGSFGNEARRAFLHAIEIERVMSAPAITIGPLSPAVDTFTASSIGIGSLPGEDARWPADHDVPGCRQPGGYLSPYDTKYCCHKSLGRPGAIVAVTAPEGASGTPG